MHLVVKLNEELAEKMHPKQNRLTSSVQTPFRINLETSYAPG